MKKDELNGVLNDGQYMQQHFKELAEIDILHLRPVYFMENTFAHISVIRQKWIMGSPIKTDLSFSLIARKDMGDMPPAVYCGLRAVNGIEKKITNG